jgi:hypothetical protein
MPVHPRDQVSTAAAIEFVKRTWGLDAYGWRERGSVPGSLHPQGLALDVPVRSDLGTQIADWFVAHPDSFGGVAEVIWRGRIWTPGRGWHAYTGPHRHDDHVHVGLRSGSGGLVGAAATAAAGALDVGPLVGGARNLVVQVAFVALGLGLLALGAWRGLGKPKPQEATT